MTGDECGHQKNMKKKKLWRRICAGTIIFLLLVLVVLPIIIWAVVTPKTPRFVLLGATVIAFNFTDPNLLSSTFQVTVKSTNPNGDNIGIYYDRLQIFASYSDQQITLPTAITPTYQDTNHGVSIWSFIVTGKLVPIAPFIWPTLKQEYETAGNLEVNFKMDGNLRWKVGTLLSGTYRLHVNCKASIPNAGMQACNVEMSKGQGNPVTYGDYPQWERGWKRERGF